MDPALMKLFDSHCHLHDERLRPILPAVFERARTAGVAGMLNCGCTEADWPEVQALATARPEIIPAYGLHPWYLGERSACWRDTLARLLESDPRAAVGEVGLDHALEERNDAEQRAVFLDSLALARDFRRPVSVHCRRAWAALIECLGRVGQLPAGLVIHSYSGSVELVEPLARSGARFSFSGSITYPANRRGRRAAAAVPLELLLVETDSPDIPPYFGDKSDGGKKEAEPLNEPANLPLVIRTIAGIRGMTPEALAQRVWENSRELFGLDR